MRAGVTGRPHRLGRMRVCPGCGERSDDRSRFCWSCGARLDAEPVRVRDIRKTVTVVFCDVVGSTTLGERQDPERLAWLMSRYFEEMAAAIERHGGTVGKFIGDAIMAVFGTPVLHEDDALRAVRAAVEMRDALVSLNEELERSFGVRIDVRIGVNTGEAIVGDPRRSDTMVTGDTVNTAERFESSAGPGEIVIGEATHRLTRHAITSEELPLLTLKGKAHPQRGYRVVDIVAGPAPSRPGRAPFVGREPERVLLRDALSRSVRERSCHLFTVLGPPGVGKSRFVAEVIRRIEPTMTVLRGACLPYGKEITFWPVFEAIREAVDATQGDRPEVVRPRLEALLEADETASLVVERVAELVGAGGASLDGDAVFWAVRRLFESMSRRRPLVVVLDDIHWAEPTFLDLVEHIADTSRDAPVTLICIARPELLEKRAGWGSRRTNATTLILGPLNSDESERLLGQLGGDVALPEAVRRRIQEAAEGVPLFVEEMLSMLLDAGLLWREGDEWHATAAAAEMPVPPTINLLLASRIEGLPDAERDVIERASVEGRVFHRGAVLALSSPRNAAEVERVLDALVRKELIRPEPAMLRGEAGFGFRHVLIRDAAYASIPKLGRADLHEGFATWLEAAIARDEDEYEDLAGYHLERAFGYRTELHRAAPADRVIAGRAGRHLATAGRRAWRRGDVPAAATLLARAAGLLQEEGGPPAEVLLELGSAFAAMGDLLRADAVLADAMTAASEVGDRRLASRATLERSFVRVLVDPSYDAHRVSEVAEAALPIFEAAGDDLGIVAALTRIAEAHWDECRFAAMEAVLDRALQHAARAGHRREVTHILGLLSWAITIGPCPVVEAITRCEQIVGQARDQPQLKAWTASMMAILEAMRDRPDAARSLYRDSHAVLADLGLTIHLASAHMCSGMAELKLADLGAAEREFRRGCALLEEIGERAQLSTMAAYLARTLVASGRFDDAARQIEVSREASSDDDLASQVLWRGSQARVLAARGDAAEAERLAREASGLAATSDFVTMRADVIVDLAHVLHGTRPAEAHAALDDALALYEAKGDVASATAVRDLADEWEAAGTLDGQRATR